MKRNLKIVLEDLRRALTEADSVFDEPEAASGTGPEAAPVAEPEADEPRPVAVSTGEPLVDTGMAIKKHLGRGIADGVGETLAAMFGEEIDFQSQHVLDALDEIEKAFLRKGRQWFTQVRAEMRDMKIVDKDRFIRAGVKVFRDIP